MNKGLYSIVDLVSKEFAGPWLDNNDGAAARRFGAWLGQSSSQPNFKSTDYALYCIGTMDITTGSIVPCFREIALNEGEEE